MIQTCDSPNSNGSPFISIKEAVAKMLAQITQVKGKDNLALSEGLGRVLADDIISPIDVPPADNSAMDGYALDYQELSKQRSLKMVGTALAGQPYLQTLLPGQCVRIMTGALIPKGANAVVMQENTLADGNNIEFKQLPSKGNSVRQAGEDIQRSQIVVTKGTQLKAAHLALIASVGVAQIRVTPKLKVGLIATGDELTPPGQKLVSGAIYESNRVALNALLADFPVDVVDLGIVKDDKPSLRDAFRQADKNCDLVISCGGVSVGEADYVKDILSELGTINFWKVAIKPGKPFAFGKLSNAWFCGLPGNPVSSYVTFQQLVTPVLQKLSGQTYLPAPHFVAKAACLIRKRPGRADYQRGIYYRDENAELWVKPNGKQGSGIMSSIANANCYMVLEQDAADVQEGESVNIQPF
ncbi:molybdopterin molybdotransferase MoeA [uncultured Paraglaciecola sp.]|uniref:molybdopterin molybdotransferase MoeA n=1 Tax=uncultured Paraglaciecola sp. TaxID=1765024 RepID=UPI0030DAD7ED|tara:strand:+ start:67486 stop:68721 length:1236 start_codon:yes stop_codon:yes gene_type:complete